MVSRVAKNPVVLPTGVDFNMVEQVLTIKGKLGQLTQAIHPLVQLQSQDKVITLTPFNDSLEANALAGTARALIQNMVHGVNQGFEIKLQLIGVGYRAKVENRQLHLTVGYSHPVILTVPESITAETPAPTEIILKGADKQVVGQFAANIRKIRPPECYKGKGIRYANESVILKEVKKK